MLIVSENGLGKRTDLEEFTVQKRGGKGIKCYKITDKTGDVIGAKAVVDENEVMMITDGGVIIQLRAQDISSLGRITSGVKMINLDQGVKVAKIAKVREKVSNGEQEFENVDDALEEIPEEMNAGNVKDAGDIEETDISEKDISQKSMTEEEILEENTSEENESQENGVE